MPVVDTDTTDGLRRLLADLRRAWMQSTDRPEHHPGDQLWDPRAFVDEGVLDAYLALLVRRWATCDTAHQIAALPAHQWTLLDTEVGLDEHTTAILRTRDVGPATLWLWPAHVHGNHWRLHILLPSTGRILLWDSVAVNLGGGGPIRETQRVALGAVTRRPWGPVEVIGRPLGGRWQSSHDCALFVLQHCEVLVRLHQHQSPVRDLYAWATSPAPDALVDPALLGSHRMVLLRRTLYHLFFRAALLGVPLPIVDASYRFCLTIHNPWIHDSVCLDESAIPPHRSLAQEPKTKRRRLDC